MRLRIGIGAFEPDEDGVSVSVDDLVSTLLHKCAGELHHLVAAQGHGGHQLRIEEAAFGRAQHPGEGVHEQLQGLRQRLVARSLGLVPGIRQSRHDVRQAVLIAREQRALWPVHQAGLDVGALSLGQTHGVHQKGPDDGGVQAFVVQDHDGVVEARRGVHHIATGKRLGRDVTHVGRHVAQAVHARQVVMAECGDGAAEVIYLQACRLCSLQHERQQLQFVEDAQDKRAVADVVAGQRWLVFLVAPLDLGHLVVGIADLLALTEQFL